MQPTKTERLRIGDVALHVQDWGGEGRPILFAHPTGFLGAVWLPIIRRLRDAGFDGKVYTYDQRGHGLSSKPDAGYDWSLFVSDTVELVGALAIRDALGVGHSAGATTLACVAAAVPGSFRRLVMIDPILFDPADAHLLERGDNPMATRTRNRRLVWASRGEIFESYRARPPYDTWTDEALRAYIEHGTFERPDGEVELLCPGRIEAQIYENAASVDGCACLAELDIPVRLVRGGRSTSFSGDRVERACAALNDGELITIDEATHYVPMEFPDEVARLVLAALGP